MISPRATIHLTVSQDKAVPLSIMQNDEITLTAENCAGLSQGTAPVYAGDYEVTPSAEGEVLKTAQKTMRKDLTIHPIPYFEVSNTAGGDTVFIGGEIERS